MNQKSLDKSSERKKEICPKTISGKHKWSEYVDSWEISHIGKGFGRTSIMKPKKLIKICEACRMYDY